MEKREARSYIFNQLKKYDKTNKYHDGIIDRAIQRVLYDIYLTVFKRNPLELQRYTKGYGYTTALPVLSEVTTGLYYTTLPVEVLAFPDKASGVRRVSTMSQGGMTFFPIDQREHDLLLSGSMANTVTSKIGYCVTPTRIEFYNISGAVINAGIRADLIIPFSAYAETDIVLIPEEKDEQGRTFTDRVLAILGVIPPVDSSDNNSDPTNTAQ